MRKSAIGICAAATALLLAIVISEKAGDNHTKDGNGDERSSAHVLAQKNIDYNHDGLDERLLLRATSGTVIENAEPGPFQGSYWKGNAALELRSADGALLSKLDVNPSFDGEKLQFRDGKSFELKLEDYNDDGYPDFTIGQYLSSNASLYTIYSLKPEGIVVLHEGLVTADHSYSIAYEKAGNNSFVNRFYDMNERAYRDVLYTWTGESFAQTECEGCEMTYDEDDSAQDVQEKDDSFTQENPVVKRLGLQLAPSQSGFEITYEDIGNVYVQNTYIAPPSETSAHEYAVHLLRSIVPAEGGGEHYRIDAVVVDPEARSFKAFPLVDADLADSYAADSVAGAYGFLDARSLLYVSVVNDDVSAGGCHYSIETLDIVSGQRAVLFDSIPQIDDNDHYGRGWLYKKGNTSILVLNSYGSGKLWNFNLLDRTVHQWEGVFRNSWPTFGLIPSPDGAEFWYANQEKRDYRLYDLDGNSLQKVGFNDDHELSKPFEWSPDGSYSVHVEAQDGGEQPVLVDDSDFPLVASDRLTFYDAEAHLAITVQEKIGSGRFVEIAGWFADSVLGDVLLAHYSVKQEAREGQEAEKSKFDYEVVDLKLGKRTAVQDDEELNRLKKQALASAGSGHKIEYKMRHGWIITGDMNYMRVDEGGE
ncbi:hypothetical protein [Paenibacillus sp. HB172176]|uniref:hypothetical protein n=1 Tax=Paenibacillus sp. HB172176 TaxID=2493690 RepID=UPI00143CAC9D|nr:hypothetical protein [Paenibacillus sp. HB172176]